MSRSQASVYRKTESMHREMKGLTPYASMSALPWIRSSFSTSTSTGSPCVSHPAFRGTSYPRMVLYLGKTSFTARVSTCPLCGMPLAVGGPS